MMKQLSLFPTTIKRAYLEADSAKKAFYDIRLEFNSGFWIVVKESGYSDRILDKRRWTWEDGKEAVKFFKRKLKNKINPLRKSKRIYNIIDYLW